MSDNTSFYKSFLVICGDLGCSHIINIPQICAFVQRMSNTFFPISHLFLYFNIFQIYTEITWGSNEWCTGFSIVIFDCENWQKGDSDSNDDLINFVLPYHHGLSTCVSWVDLVEWIASYTITFCGFSLFVVLNISPLS